MHNDIARYLAQHARTLGHATSLDPDGYPIAVATAAYAIASDETLGLSSAEFREQFDLRKAQFRDDWDNQRPGLLRLLRDVFPGIRFKEEKHDAP